jgi:20S proteasome alpha/beta subunit
MLARYAALPSPSLISGPQVLLLSKFKAPINHAESTLLQQDYSLDEGKRLARRYPPVPKTLGKDGKRVTIGIGLACESGNCLILAADTRGTYQHGHLHANEEVGKQFQLPAGFFACIAGKLVHCESFIAYFTTYLDAQGIDPLRVLHDDVRIPMRLAQADTVRDVYDGAMLKETGLRFAEWKELMQKDPAMFKRGTEIFKKTEMPLEALVGGFSEGNFVLLKMVDKEQIEIVPSFETIGSGADFALNHLNDRAQNLHYSFQRSVVHIAEALENAKLDSGVGDAADWVIMERGKIARLPAKHEVLEELKSYYAGRKTDSLDSDDAVRKKLKGILYQAPLMPFKYSALEA